MAFAQTNESLECRSDEENSKIIISKNQKFCCEDCILKNAQTKNNTKSKCIKKLIYADFSNLMQENSFGGTRYFLIMED